jgi:hypothetical protein
LKAVSAKRQVATVFLHASNWKNNYCSNVRCSLHFQRAQLV